MSWTEGLARIWCSLRGHDEVLHFERRRLSLRCQNCGHETAGWLLGSEPDRAKPTAGDGPHADISGFGGVRKLHEA